MSRYDSPGYSANVPGVGPFDPRAGATPGSAGVDLPSPAADPVAARDPFAGSQPADLDSTTASQDADYSQTSHGYSYGSTGAGDGHYGHHRHPNGG